MDMSMVPEHYADNLLSTIMDEIEEDAETSTHPESLDETEPYNKDRNPEDFGKDWRDWSPFPDDYT